MDATTPLGVLRLKRRQRSAQKQVFPLTSQMSNSLAGSS
jgi:hypothetical protein